MIMILPNLPFVEIGCGASAAATLPPSQAQRSGRKEEFKN